MAISCREVEVTMANLGGIKIERQGGGWPYYQVGEVLIKPDNHYTATVVKKEHTNFLKQAKQELEKLGERKWPVKDDFEPYGEGRVETVRGLVTLVLVIQERFSEELLNKKVNNIYQELLSAPWIKQNLSQMYTEPTEYQESAAGLATLLKELTKSINPFANPNLKLREPIEYLNKVAVLVSAPNEHGYANWQIWTTAGFITAHFYENMISTTIECLENPMDEQTKKIEITHDIEFMRHDCQIEEDGIHYSEKVSSERVYYTIRTRRKDNGIYGRTEEFSISMLHPNSRDVENVKKAVTYTETVLSRLQDSIIAQLAEQVTIGNRTYNLKFLTGN